MLARAEVDQVKMGDGDLLSVMVGCCRGGLELQARKNLVQKLPRKTGYFQEMRNMVPQLLQAGGPSLAMEIFLDDRFGRHEDRKDKGKFVLESVVRSDLSPAQSMEVVDKMELEGYERAMEYLIESSMKYGTAEYNEGLNKGLKEAGKHPLDTKSIKDFTQFLRRAVAWNGDAIMERVNNLRCLGFQLPHGIFSNDLIFGQLDLAGGVTPRDTVNRIMKELPNVQLSFLTNSMLQCLLNKEDKEHQTAAINYLLNGTTGRFLKPTAWSQSLVRSFLATGDTEQLVTFLWYCSRPSIVTDDRSSVSDVFSGLTCVPAVLHRYEGTEQSVEVQLRVVLEALIKERVGVPGDVAAKLQEQEAVLAELLQEAVAVWEAGADYWTEERTAEYFAERKAMHLPARDGSSPRTGVSEYSGVPESLAEMEAVHAKLEAQGRVNKGLVSKLLDALCAAGQLDKALALRKYAVEQHYFNLGVMNTNNLLGALLTAGRLGEALDFLQENLGSGGDRKVFGSTFVDMLVLLAEQGKHEQVLELAQSYSPNQFVNGSNANAHDVCDVYSKGGQEEKMETIREVLFSQLWMKKNDMRAHFGKLKTLLEAKDMTKVLDEVETIVKDTRKFPLKQEVSKQLILMEDLDLLQRMLDISIEAQGEERALMDLAMSFLDLGKKAQAKKLLETPGLRYNQTQMAYMAAHFRSSGNLEALESMVSLSRNVFGCDRDFLFSQLVEAFHDSPDRVEEVWMEIQEEGHAPSDSLKLAIAGALEAGGRKVPFEVPKEYVRKVEEQPAARVRMAKARSPQPTSSQPKSPQPSSSQPKAKKERRPDNLRLDHAVASPILAAIQGNDLKTASELIKEGIANKTLKTSARSLLEKFCQADLAEGAKISAFVQNSLDDEEGSVLPQKEIVKHTRTIMVKYGVNNDLAGLADFMEMLSENQRHHHANTVKNSEKTASFLHSPAEYLSVVTNDPSGATPDSWMLGPLVLKEANVSTLTQLEELACQGNVAAACVLCKVGLGKEDSGLVERSWEQLEDKKVWAPQVFNAPKREDVQLLTKTVKSEDLGEMLKNYLGNSNNLKIGTVVDLTTVALSQNSIQLEDLQDHTLMSLARTREFKDKVKEILEARKLQPTGSSSS